MHGEGTGKPRADYPPTVWCRRIFENGPQRMLWKAARLEPPFRYLIWCLSGTRGSQQPVGWIPRGRNWGGNDWPTVQLSRSGICAAMRLDELELEEGNRADFWPRLSSVPILRDWQGQDVELCLFLQSLFGNHPHTEEASGREVTAPIFQKLCWKVTSAPKDPDSSQDLMGRSFWDLEWGADCRADGPEAFLEEGL